MLKVKKQGPTVKRKEFGIAFIKGKLFFEKFRGCTTSEKFVFVHDSTHGMVWYGMVWYGKVTLFKHGISIRYTFTLKNRKTNFLTNLKLR